MATTLPQMTSRFWLGLVSWATLVWRFLVRHLFTIPAVLLSYTLLFLLPQSKNLLWQPPSLGSMTTWEALISIGLTLYLPTLFVIYGFLSAILIPPPFERINPRGGLWGRIERVRRRVLSWVDAPLFWLGGARRSQVLKGSITLLILAAILVLATKFFDEDLPTWWRVSGTTYAIWIVLVGLWVLCARSGRDWIGVITYVTGRGILLLIVSMLFGALMWFLPDQFPSLFSYRIYTLWAIVQIVFLLISSARIVDFAHTACNRDDREGGFPPRRAGTPWNVRALVSFVAIAWLLLLPSDQVGRLWRLPPRPADKSLATNRPPTVMPTGPGVRQIMPSMQSSPVGDLGSHGQRMPLISSGKSPTLSMDESVESIWFRAIEERIAECPTDKPLIFVAASGGGSRAAMFSALVYEALRHTPLYPERAEAKPPDGATDVERQAFQDSKLRTLGDQIVLISSVSGGSLASAYYVSQSYPHLRVRRGRGTSLDDQIPQLVPASQRTRNTWRNVFPNDIYARMHAKSLLMLDETRIGRGRAVSGWAGPRFDQAVERVAYESEKLAIGRNSSANSEADAEPIAPWLATSAFVDDMATDFMAPMLRAVLNPGLERGTSVTRFWESQFGWRDVDDIDLHRQPNSIHQELGVVANGAPVILFNACDVAQGSRLVIGFPPVPAGIIRDPLARPSSHTAYSLTDRGDPYYHVSLAEAVRLSANFPFGFEVARLPLSEGDDTILALDGGIVDNSGIDSIVYLLDGLSRQAELYRRKWAELKEQFDRPPAPDSFLNKKREQDELLKQLQTLTCESMPGRAYRLLNILARRKVILIQIDSGTKDIQTGGTNFSKILASISPVVFRPFQALNNAGYTTGEQVIELYDEAIKKLDVRAEPYCDCDDRASITSNRMAIPSYRMAMPSIERILSPPQAPAKILPLPLPLPLPETSMPGPPQRVIPNAPLITRVRLTCNQSSNIMTAFTLGPEDKAQVIVQFLIEWRHQRPVIEQVFRMESKIKFLEPYSSKTPPARELDWTNDNEYLAFVKGQKLVDRARAEFYQMIFARGATNIASFQLENPASNAFALEDIKKYDALFEERNSTTTDDARRPSISNPQIPTTRPPVPEPAAPPAPPAPVHP